MSVFYYPSDKESINTRNKIFLEYGATELYKRDFIRSPFSTSWFGRNNMGDFTYEFIRLKEKSILEFLVVHISKGDSYVKIYLNVFRLAEKIQSQSYLNAKDALKLNFPPFSLSKMRLRKDDYKFIPIISSSFYKEHKIGFYLSKAGFKKKVNKLAVLLRQDCKKIDTFITRWHEKHTMQTADLNDFLSR